MKMPWEDPHRLSRFVTDPTNRGDTEMSGTSADPARAAALADASEAARAIAKRCRDKAATKLGDDYKHWHAMAAGASMVALRLTEMSDAAGRP